jgi:hypothetical protein
VQDFFFGEDFLLRRHYYSVDVAGGFGAAQLTFEDRSERSKWMRGVANRGAQIQKLTSLKP